MARSYQQLEALIAQDAYQIYRDDAGINTATPYAPINTPASVTANGRARVRVQIHNLDTISFASHYILEYNHNNTGWEPCTAQTSSLAHIVDSPHFIDGAATAQRLSSEPFTIGEGIETERESAQITLPAGYTTEIEWSLLLHNSLQPGDILQFRVIAISTTPWDPNNYTGGLLIYYSFPTIYISSNGGNNMAITETVANLTEYGIAIATSETSAYKATHLIDVVSCDVSPRATRIVTMPGRGALSPRRALTSRVWAEGSLTVESTPNHLPLVLMLSGFAPTTTGSIVPYTHTFALGTGRPNRYGTLVLWHNNTTPPVHEVFAGLSARRISLRWNAETDDTLQVSLDLLGTIAAVHQSDTRTDLFTSATPPADAEPPFAQAFASIETPTGTSINRCTAVDLTIDLARDLRWTLRASTRPRGHQPVRAITVSGRLTMTFENDEDYRRFYNQASPTYPYQHANNPSAFITSLKINLTNGLPGTNTRSISITLPNIVYAELAPRRNQDEIVMLEVGFQALYDATSTSTATIDVTNSASGTTYNPATATIPGLGV